MISPENRVALFGIMLGPPVAALIDDEPVCLAGRSAPAQG